MDENLENVVDVPEVETPEEEVTEVDVEDLGDETVDATDIMDEEFVSGGDSTVEGGSSDVQTIINEFTLDGAEVYVVQEYTLFGETAKPLSDYSVVEGLLLLIFLVLLAGMVFKLIGGVLNCSMLFKK